MVITWRSEASFPQISATLTTAPGLPARTMRPVYALPFRTAIPDSLSPCASFASSLTSGVCSPVYGEFVSIVTTLSPPTGAHQRVGVRRNRGLPPALAITGGGVGALEATG